MSRQLTFSATVCTLTLALFALVAGPGTASGGNDASARFPFAVSAAIN